MTMKAEFSSKLQEPEVLIYVWMKVTLQVCICQDHESLCDYSSTSKQLPFTFTL